jgi:septal ring factor EnvC (AmiA/AmiB activator)
VERVRRLSRLTARAEELRGQQEGHQQRAQELRGQIKAGELACGRMTQQMLEIQAAMTQMSQQVLEIQRAIGLRKRHINEDEERLSQELRSRARKTEEIMEIVSQTNAIAVAMSAEASIGNP